MRLMRIVATLFAIVFACKAFAQMPVQGDELPKLLGQQKTSTQVQSLESFIGGSYEAKGIKLHYNPDGKLTRIELFNDNSPWGDAIQQFQGQMPRGITFADKIVDAKKKIGEGFEIDGEVSGIYFLNKHFELNNFDSYRFSVEFITGRLISVSMILVEGGSGNLMEDGSTNKSDFKGENFITMVKKSKANFELQKLITLFDRFHTYADKTHLIYAENGLEVVTDYAGLIQEVIVYNEGQTTSQGHKTGAFKYPLPYGLRFQDSPADVSQKLGTPAGEENGAMYFNYGPSRLKVYFSGNRIAKIAVVINSDYKVPTPSPPAPKTVKPK